MPGGSLTCFRTRRMLPLSFPPASIVVTACRDSDFLLKNLIDEPMLLVDAFRPATCQLMLERFRLADAAERIVLRFLDQPNEAQRLLSIVLHHHAGFSKPAGSNFKLRAGVVKRDVFRSVFSFEKTLSHRLALQQVGGFPFGGDFTPEFDRNNYADRLAGFIRHVLDLRLRRHSYLRGYHPSCRLLAQSDSRRTGYRSDVAVLRRLNKAIITFMRADPKPDETFSTFLSECPMTIADPCRPKPTDLLKADRRMARVRLEQLEVLIGEIADFFRELPVVKPELG